MDIPPKHMHSPSWDYGSSKRKESNTSSAATHSHQNSANDSFFNRVFGYHSVESSRAASPVPSLASHTQQTKSSTFEPNTTNTKKSFNGSSSSASLTQSHNTSKTRHTRNSSAGNIPIPHASPLSISSKMQRR
ncbi:hypothetical protein CU098_011219, partial [Rhizopus stolonifer]